jgi:hypothetical protein
MNPPALDKLTTALSQTHDTTLSGPHHCSHPVRLTADIERSISLCHTRSRYRKTREPIKPTQCPPLEPTLRLKFRRLACDANRVPFGVESSNHRTRALTGD